jgi:4'-phosphopantetheinyl transferase
VGERPLSLHCDVAVWRVELDTPLPAALECVLSRDEWMRASRFRSDRQRQRFLLRRSALRTILGQLLGCAGAAVPLATTGAGKPYVHGQPALRFSVTDSDSLALIAVAHGHDVGIDLERLHPSHGAEEVARHFFTRGEVAALDRLPNHERWRACLHCWTRKEAYVKARGAGLSLGLDGFVVPVGPCPAPVRIHHADDTSTDQPWWLCDVHIAADFAAALVVGGTQARVTIRDWVPCWPASNRCVDPESRGRAPKVAALTTSRTRR